MEGFVEIKLSSDILNTSQSQSTYHFSVTPTSVVFGSVYSLQQLSLSLVNVSLGQVSTVEMDQMDRGG